MQKAFSLSRCCNKLLRVGKNVPCAKETAKKTKTVYFGCRKRFLCPDAVLLHCEWAKKRFLRRKKPFFSLSWILL